MVVSFLTYHAPSNTGQQSRSEKKSYGTVLFESIVFSIVYYGIIWIMALIIHAMHG